MKAMCSIIGCSRVALWRGMCGMHYQRVQKHGDPQYIPVRSYRRPVRDRLFANTVTTPAGCVERRGSGNRNGYKLIQIGGRARLAHRVSFELENGPIPDGLQVCHHCDNPPCINPLHLFLGTQADNMQDRHRKGRTRVHARSAS